MSKIFAIYTLLFQATTLLWDEGYSSDPSSVVHTTVLISLRTGGELQALQLPLAKLLKFKVRKVENENCDSLSVSSRCIAWKRRRGGIQGDVLPFPKQGWSRVPMRKDNILRQFLLYQTWVVFVYSLKLDKHSNICTCGNITRKQTRILDFFFLPFKPY